MCIRDRYTTEEKIGFLQETSMTCKEIIELNKLLDKFDESDMELINKACNINFKIGFRAAAELMK